MLTLKNTIFDKKKSMYPKLFKWIFLILPCFCFSQNLTEFHEVISFNFDFIKTLPKLNGKIKSMIIENNGFSKYYIYEENKVIVTDSLNENKEEYFFNSDDKIFKTKLSFKNVNHYFKYNYLYHSGKIDTIISETKLNEHVRYDTIVLNRLISKNDLTVQYFQKNELIYSTSLDSSSLLRENYNGFYYLAYEYNLEKNTGLVTIKRAKNQDIPNDIIELNFDHKGNITSIKGDDTYLSQIKDDIAMGDHSTKTVTYNFKYIYDKYDNWIVKEKYINGDMKNKVKRTIEYDE